jgi:uncharacterized protein YpmS
VQRQQSKHLVFHAWFWGISSKNTRWFSSDLHTGKEYWKASRIILLSFFSTYCMWIWFIGVTSCKDDRDGRQNKRERSTNHRRQSGTEETLQKGVDSSHKQQCLDDNCLVLLAKEETPLVNNKRILSKATELSRLVILHCFLPSAERVQ